MDAALLVYQEHVSGRKVKKHICWIFPFFTRNGQFFPKDSLCRFPLTYAQPSGVEEDFHIGEKKVEAEFDEQADESNYDEQVDFYGSSMEEFSGERSDGNLIGHRQEAALAAGYSENIEMVTGIKEEASHLR